jgi:hypothetical protein
MSDVVIGGHGQCMDIIFWKVWEDGMNALLNCWNSVVWKEVQYVNKKMMRRAVAVYITNETSTGGG